MKGTSKILAIAVGVALQLPALQQTAAPASFLIARPRPPRRDIPLPPTPLEIVLGQLRAIEAKPASLSTGLPYRRNAALQNAAQLPLEGVGYWMLRPERNTHYGTDDMIRGLIETAAALREADPELQPLAVGDISGPKGGRLALHLSHRSGRDADLLFFWTDAAGRPVLTEDFVHFDASGRARYVRKEVRFDVARNWALVRGLLANERIGRPGARIFIWRPLREKLLAHARRAEKNPAILATARRSLLQSRESEGLHNDHFHVRIACSVPELALGCRD